MKHVNLWVAIPTVLAALSWLTFIVYYWIRATWWRGPLGRNTMFVSMAVFLILVRLSILNFFPEVGTRTVSGFIFYLLMGYLAFDRMFWAEKSQQGFPYPGKKHRKFKPDGK